MVLSLPFFGFVDRSYCAPASTGDDIVRSFANHIGVSWFSCRSMLRQCSMRLGLLAERPHADWNGCSKEALAAISRLFTNQP
jgi:hypothetical protein